MDPVLGKYINLIQVDSDRKTWLDFLDKVEKLKYQKGIDFIPNNTGNPSAYFKADVANNAKVKKLRDTYNVSSFGVEGIDQTNIVGKLVTGAKVFLKETKEIATIGKGFKNEYGFPIVKENGTVIRRELHEFVVITEDVNINALINNPYGIHSDRTSEKGLGKYNEALEGIKSEKVIKKNLDESIEELLKKKITESLEEHHLHTREDKIGFILDKTKNHPAGQYDAAKLMSMSDDALDQLYHWIEQDSHLLENSNLHASGKPTECGMFAPENIARFVDSEKDEVFEGKASYKTADVKLTPIKDSAFIQAAGYDPEMETMYLKFRTGVYEYYDVPEEIYDQLLVAPSVGKYFHQNIRNVYTYAMAKKYMTPGRKPINESSEYDEAAEYVDYLLGGDWEMLFDKIGMQMPHNIDATDFIPTMEQAKELGIEYFTSHPEEIEYAKISMNEYSDTKGESNREAKESFVIKNCWQLDAYDESKYGLDSSSAQEVSQIIYELPNEDLDYLYSKLKGNTIDLDNRLNEFFDKKK